MISKSKVATVLLLTLLLTSVYALFPPRQTESGWAQPRRFLFSANTGPNIVVGSSGDQINAGRLLAELVLIWCVAGLVLLYLWVD